MCSRALRRRVSTSVRNSPVVAIAVTSCCGPPLPSILSHGPPRIIRRVATTNARDELLDRLLGVPLDRFVEERNRLAREARAAGDRDTASWLASLRRPAPHVWAIDQLARSDPRGMLGLTNLARRPADAQSPAVQDRDPARWMQEPSP